MATTGKNKLFSMFNDEEDSKMAGQRGIDQPQRGARVSRKARKASAGGSGTAGATKTAWQMKSPASSSTTNQSTPNGTTANDVKEMDIRDLPGLTPKEKRGSPKKSRVQRRLNPSKKATPTSSEKKKSRSKKSAKKTGKRLTQAEIDEFIKRYEQDSRDIRELAKLPLSSKSKRKMAKIVANESATGDAAASASSGVVKKKKRRKNGSKKSESRRRSKKSRSMRVKTDLNDNDDGGSLDEAPRILVLTRKSDQAIFKGVVTRCLMTLGGYLQFVSAKDICEQMACELNASNLRLDRIHPPLERWPTQKFRNGAFEIAIPVKDGQRRHVIISCGFKTSVIVDNGDKQILEDVTQMVRGCPQIVRNYLGYGPTNARSAGGDPRKRRVKGKFVCAASLTCGQEWTSYSAFVDARTGQSWQGRTQFCKSCGAPGIFQKYKILPMNGPPKIREETFKERPGHMVRLCGWCDRWGFKRSHAEMADMCQPATLYGAFKIQWSVTTQWQREEKYLHGWFSGVKLLDGGKQEEEILIHLQVRPYVHIARD